MIELEPVTFISEIIDSTSDCFVFSIPKHIQDRLENKKAKYIYIKFIRVLNEKEDFS